MTEVPKIVVDRLRAPLPEHVLTEQGVSAQAHPDADRLTAFAEQALSTAERDGVLAHLARCSDCREVIALALPAMDIVSAPTASDLETATASRAGAPAPQPKTRFFWPSLRWAALAAGVALAASVLLMHPGKLNQPTVHPTPTGAKAVTPESGSQVASSSTTSSTIPSPSTNPPATLARTDDGRVKSETRLSKKLDAGTVAAPSRPAEPGTPIAGNKIAENKLADQQKDASDGDNLSVAASARDRAFDTAAGRGASEAARASATEIAPSAESNVMARNEAPAIEKAKPALQEAEAKASQKSGSAGVAGSAISSRNPAYAAKPALAAKQNLAHSSLWAIAAGVLQRSLDSGQSWQSVLRADHALLCSANHGADVWAGGEAGTLYHSSNNGVTWKQVQPSVKGQLLSSDVTHIDANGSDEIVVSTANDEIWSSVDGGKTWAKQ